MTGPQSTDRVSHTPGPWTIDPATGLDVRGPDGKDVAVSLCREMGGLQFDMATIGPEHRQQAFDNALLIAAAPELLAGAKAMLAARDGKASIDAVIALRDAIAKAEGRS